MDESLANTIFSGNPLRDVVLENALDAVIAIDSRNIIIDWNKQAEKIFNWRKEEVLGKVLSDTVIPFDFRKSHEAGLERFLKTGQGPILNSRIEVIGIRRDGSKFPIELTVIPVKLGDSFVFYSFLRDITDKKIIEKELFFRSEVLEHSLNGIDVVNEDGKFIYANRAYLKMWGYETLEEILGTSPVTHCADPLIPAKIIGELKKNGECDIEFVARRKDGSHFDVRMWARRALDPAGKEIYPTTSIDITEQKNAREALKKSEQLYHSTFEKAPVGILNTGRDGSLINVNDKFCEMLGYTREELKTFTFVQLTHPEDRDLDQIMFQELKEGKRNIFDREKRYLRKDGSVLWVHVTGQMLFEADGTIKHSITIVQDISDRKLAEENKALLELRLRLLSELSRDLLENPLEYNERLKKFVRSTVPLIADWCAVDTVEEDGTVKLAAVAHLDPSKIKLAFDMRSKFPHKNRNTGPSHVINTRQSELVSDLNPQVLKAIAINEEHFEMIKNLGMRSYICVPIVAHGTVLGAFTMVSEKKIYDQSDLRFAEDLATRSALALYNSKLYASAKEAIQSRDEFLSIASHELKTPLTSLKLQVQLQARLLKKNAQDVSPDKERIAQNAEKNERLVMRLERLIDDMLDISRIRTGRLSINKEKANLVTVAKEVIDRMQEPFFAATGSQIKLESPLEANCQMDVMRIEQIIMNFLQNALKYGLGKKVEVVINDAPDFVMLSVADEGMGISEANQLKIFERFERAVDSNEISGLGLGLYISQQIVKAHNGKIWVSSQLNKGSVFHVQLPKS